MKPVVALLMGAVVLAKPLLASDRGFEAHTTGGFAAGTKLLTDRWDDPMVEIEDVRRTYSVLTYNSDGEAKQSQFVHESYIHTVETIYKLTFINDATLTLAGDQIVLTPVFDDILGDESVRWVPTKDLVVGSVVISNKYDVLIVKDIEKQDGVFEVYNIELDDNHTFFAGKDAEVVVHNARFNIKLPGSPVAVPKPKWVREGQRGVQVGMGKLGKLFGNVLPEAVKKHIRKVTEPLVVAWLDKNRGSNRTNPSHKTPEEIEKEKRVERNMKVYCFEYALSGAVLTFVLSKGNLNLTYEAAKAGCISGIVTASADIGGWIDAFERDRENHI